MVSSRTAWLLVATLTCCIILSACGSGAPSSGTSSPTGRIVVTGYGSITPSGGRSDPASVTLSASEAHRLHAAFDAALGNHDDQWGCHALYVLYSIAFYKRDASSSPSEALGEGCAGDNVWYPVPGGASRAGGPNYEVGFDAECRLLKLVVSVLPPGHAGATRSSLPGCLRWERRS